MPTNLEGQRVVVTGGAGFLGRKVCALLESRGCSDILVPRRVDYDLTTESAVERLYTDFEPDIVLHLAAEVGGIGANESMGDMFGSRLAFKSLATIRERYSGFSSSPLFVSTHRMGIGFLPVTSRHSLIGRFT